MSRPKGARSVLIRVDYGTIGGWAGITPDMAKRLARQGLFNARDLHSALRWANGLRQQLGLSLIGAPTDVGEGVADDGPEVVTSTPPEMGGILRYNPSRASFEEEDA